MRKIIVAAMTIHRVIGVNGKLPWHMPSDLKRFRSLTKGHTVIGGRKTFDEIVVRTGELLPERKNIIVSSSPKIFSDLGGIQAGSYREALEKVSASEEKVFIIGGESIYYDALPDADEMFITYVKMPRPSANEISKFPEWRPWFWNEAGETLDYSLVDEGDEYESQLRHFVKRESSLTKLKPPRF